MMDRYRTPRPRPGVPPHLSRPGEPPNMTWPAAVRRLWLDGWERGYWVGYYRALYERRELDRAERVA
jgi:hypothetical protein